ncbi:uncharacterized protein A4U43_C04F4080 [Asparagus officinalis]|uniref:Uncharacterized protein n=1 Tax=Asparagus officinalis TaxID=4686 RepID=A0A5P1F2L7_ASPOF|nr:uncharacterized protein A4U43_C04F4080 [Asparagus officinalis]
MSNSTARAQVLSDLSSPNSRNSNPPTDRAAMQRKQGSDGDEEEEVEQGGVGARARDVVTSGVDAACRDQEEEGRWALATEQGFCSRRCLPTSSRRQSGSAVERGRGSGGGAGTAALLAALGEDFLAAEATLN